MIVSHYRMLLIATIAFLPYNLLHKHRYITSIHSRKTIFYDDFEDDPVGSLPDRWTVAWSSTDYGVTDKNAASGGKSL